jgi:hypothetical protein
MAGAETVAMTTNVPTPSVLPVRSAPSVLSSVLSRELAVAAGVREEGRAGA